MSTSKLTRKIQNILPIKSMAERLAMGMMVVSIVLALVIGLSIFDLRKFNHEVTDLNVNAMPNITTSAELAASLQTTLSNVNKLSFAESQAHRRIILAEVNTEMAKTKSLSANMGTINVAHEILNTLLITVENSVLRLNNLVEKRITAKQRLNQSTFTLIQYDVDFVTNKYAAATATESEILNNWENNLDQVILRAIKGSQTSRMRDVLRLRRETVGFYAELAGFEARVSPDVYNHMVNVQENLHTITNGPDGVFTLSIDYLSAIARSRGLENQTRLLTEEANVLVSSIFGQTRQYASNYAQEISNTLNTHTNFLIISAFFILISFAAIYYYFRDNLVRRLISLSNQILDRVKGERLPIKVEGDDEITDIAKNFGFFINEIDNQQAKLISAIDLAEKANLSKTEFLANISHDIRTPLTGVKGALSLLDNTKLSKKQALLIQKAKLSSEILHSIINDLLDISRLEKGMLPLYKDSVDLRSLVTEVVSMMEELKNEKGLDLIIDIKKNVPELVFLDPKRFTQILFNLLSNSLKFTENGSINISIKTLKDKNGEKLLQLMVKDTGIGISKEHQKTMFERFQRFNTQTNSNIQSTGLGLSICKYLVELMQGDIQVKSASNKGSSFTVTIPCEEVSSKAVINKEASTTTKKVGKNILVVEDNDINQQLIQMILETANHKITLVTNGKEALDKVNSNDYDLILMDVQMPVMDGKEATKHIRDMAEPKCGVPIIALTAHAMDFEADQLIALGMNAIITKPIDTKLLETAVQHYSL